jgi:hypothetical protein
MGLDPNDIINKKESAKNWANLFRIIKTILIHKLSQG